MMDGLPDPLQERMHHIQEVALVMHLPSYNKFLRVAREKYARNVPPHEHYMA
jgi:hypothetical protein